MPTFFELYKRITDWIFEDMPMNESFYKPGDNIPFRLAKNFSKGRKQSISSIVIHTMEAPNGPATAENIANWFVTQPANGTIQPNGQKFYGTSIHYNIDQDSIVQNVNESDIAWHTSGYVKGKEVNAYTIGIEHAGFAKQTPEEWQNPEVQKMLRASAALVAELCARYNIPAVHTTPEMILEGQSGIGGHSDYTTATKTGNHWDPGPSFPWDQYIGMVQEYMKTQGDPGPPRNPSTGSPGTVPIQQKIDEGLKSVPPVVKPAAEKVSSFMGWGILIGGFAGLAAAAFYLKKKVFT